MKMGWNERFGIATIVQVPGRDVRRKGTPSAEKKTPHVSHMDGGSQWRREVLKKVGGENQGR